MFLGALNQNEVKEKVIFILFSCFIVTVKCSKLSRPSVNNNSSKNIYRSLNPVSSPNLKLSTHHLILSSQQCYEVYNVIISILKIKKVKLREVKKLPQGYTATKIEFSL